MAKKAIVIEDDPNIAELLSMHLEDLDFVIDHIAEGNAGYEAAANTDYDLVLLDVMLPGMDGMEICRKLRMIKPRLPIVMLTAKGDELDRILGLELGADDYITKPFSVRELIARIKAVMRRAQGQVIAVPEGAGKTVLNFGKLTVDLEKRRVTRGGEEVQLTSTEFDLLAFLAKSPGKPYTREDLLTYVWEYEYAGYERTVTSHVNRLRAKIEPDPANPTYILTARGVGYCFTDREGQE
jgi:DNA-binding response OmpR family regulator